MKGGYRISLKNNIDLTFDDRLLTFTDKDSNKRQGFISAATQVAQEYPTIVNNGLIRKLKNVNDDFNTALDKNIQRTATATLESKMNELYKEIYNQLMNVPKTPPTFQVDDPTVQTRGLSNAVSPQEVPLATNKYFKTASKKIDEINYKTYDEFAKDITDGKTKLKNIFSTLSGDTKEDPFQCMAKGYDTLLSAN